jgi:hypothetical protein
MRAWRFLRVLWHVWGPLMSGAFSVPFAIAAVVSDQKYGPLIYGSMAYTALALACYLLWARNQTLIDRLSPKMKLFLQTDPFGQTTGIEIGKMENGDDAPYIQVCVEAITDAPIYGPEATITKIEHRKNETDGFQEVFGESRQIDWSWQTKGAVTLSKDKPIRMNIVRYNYKSPAPYDITDNAPYKLAQFYSSIQKTGEYRYTIHIEGRDAVPARAHVYVKWKVRGHPKVALEAIGNTIVTTDDRQATMVR